MCLLVRPAFPRPLQREKNERDTMNLESLMMGTLGCGPCRTEAEALGLVLKPKMLVKRNCWWV
jgi:hypothetical protein